MNNMETIMETGIGNDNGNGNGNDNGNGTGKTWKCRTYKTTRNAVRIANNLMDQKFEGLCSEEMQITREIEQHTMETTRGQQPPQQTTEFWRT
ncbi:hypothetical protein Tco_1369107 [Tanacetum coccineum]